MLVRLAVFSLLHKRIRFGVTVLGLSSLFFLSTANVGLLLGWISTTTAIIRNADADIWVMAPHIRAFDYGGPIPRIRVDQVRNVQGVSWAEAVISSFSVWKAPDGKLQNVEVVGIDASAAGAPWILEEGTREELYSEGSVIVDRLYLANLGVTQLGDEGELFGSRAVVRGISRDVRTFTALPYVFTSLRSARQFILMYAEDEITFVLARCARDTDPNDVCERVRSEIPDIIAMTREQFARSTAEYWMLETGAGATVLTSAVLGLCVSAVIASQSLYSVANDHVDDFTALVALGYSKEQLAAVVLLQGLILATLSMLLGGIGFWSAARLTTDSPLPLEMTFWVGVGVVAVFAVSCIAATILALQVIRRIDPAIVLRGR